MARSSAAGGRGRGRGGRGSSRGSTDTIGRQQSDARHHTSMPSVDESNGDDDGSFVHVDATRRGPASQVQLPEPINRPWIWITYGQFSNQNEATRIILSILHAMWSGPWQTWKHVPKEDKERLFERFQGYFQWEEQWNAQIYRCWEKCNASKFGDLLGRARKGAMAMATKKGLEIGDDMLVLLDFKPTWMGIEPWRELLEIWNTDEFKEKSMRNKDNRLKSKGGKHTLGSQTFVTAKLKADKKFGHETLFRDMWMQSRCRKGSRPLDKVSECNSPVVNVFDEETDEGIDSEENVQEQNLTWVDERSSQTWKTYEGYLVEKYGKDESKHPEYDSDLWFRATGGKNKGKLYGFSNVSDPLALLTGTTPSTSCSSTTHEPSKSDSEIQRLNGVIEELVKEKDATHERMATIEALLKVVSQNIQLPS